MIADLEPPKIDANGIPILPGYRKPFTSESAKRYSLKALEVRTHNRQARLLAAKTQMPSSAVEIAAIISATLRQYRRCLAACVASTSGKEAAMWSRAAKDAFDCWQSLLGNSTTRSKRGSTKHIAHVSPMANVEPIASQKSPQKSDAVEPVSTSETTVQSSQVVPESSGNQSSNPTSAFSASDRAASTSDVPF